MPFTNPPLLLLCYLWATTDETHPITLEQLKEHMETGGLKLVTFKPLAFCSVK